MQQRAKTLQHMSTDSITAKETEKDCLIAMPVAVSGTTAKEAEERLLQNLNKKTVSAAA